MCQARLRGSACFLGTQASAGPGFPDIPSQGKVDTCIGVSLNGGNYPTNPGCFPTKHDQHLGCEMGVSPFTESSISHHWRKENHRLKVASNDGEMLGTPGGYFNAIVCL